VMGHWSFAGWCFVVGRSSLAVGAAKTN